MLIEILLAWNQLDSFFNSYSQFPSVDLGRYEEKIVLVSSAKSMKSKAFDTLHKSLIYYKNNNGPKIDPWGWVRRGHFHDDNIWLQLPEFLLF